MPQIASVYRVLIASPGDVRGDCAHVEDAVTRWNLTFGEREAAVFLPVRWESAVAPFAGGDPQSLVNEQIVDHADAAIGLFWNRLGTPTPRGPSGTAEEINEMVRSGRHVLVFRCRKPIDPALSDPQEAMRLRDFLEEWRRSAIVSDYSTPEALQTSLLTNLTGLVDRLRRQEVSAEDGAPPIGERPTAVGCSIAERDEVTEINGSNVFQRRYSLALKNLTGTDLTLLAVHPLPPDEFGLTHAVLPHRALIPPGVTSHFPLPVAPRTATASIEVHWLQAGHEMSEVVELQYPAVTRRLGAGDSS